MKAEHTIKVWMDDEGGIHADSHMQGNHVTPQELHVLSAAMLVELGNCMTRLLGIRQDTVSESLTIDPDLEVN